MKIRLLLVIAALWANGALAFNPADVEKLRSTGSCPKCDLSDFEFPDKAKFEKAILISTNLSGSRLNKAILREANLRGASLSAAKLNNANLSGTNLKGAFLFNASLIGANLSGTKLDNANLENANLENAKSLKRF